MNLKQTTNELLKKLFPICRSLTVNGVRQTLCELQKITSFDIRNIPSGSKCYDWTVPQEWNIHKAYIKDHKGKTVVDFKNNNLHVVNYSTPINTKLSFSQLKPHLHYLPELPDAIPYRTTYYNNNWGFCLTHDQYKQLNQNDTYHVSIDSTFTDGYLNYGECIINGISNKEYLISTYCCHPSLANDNLSGVILWTLLLRELKKQPTKHTYRFIIVPETIGSIAYLSQHEKAMQKTCGGFVITTVAGPGKFGYKHTYLHNHTIDKVVQQTFKENNINYVSYKFDINGSDETQYASPGFRIPTGTICKDKYYEYKQYHTSLDNLGFVSSDSLIQTLKLYLSTIQKLEMNTIFKSLCQYGEPMLGKRGLYPSTGGKNHQNTELDIIKWLMFHGDGHTELIDTAEQTGIPMEQLYATSQKLVAHKLLKEVL